LSLSDNYATLFTVCRPVEGEKCTSDMSETVTTARGIALI